jgi:phosphoglycolate phosphatase-like HAD superfamily hydrolase
MKAKAIIYDFDGVICDSVNIKTDAFAKLYEEYGKNIQDHVVDYHIQNGGISRVEKIKYYQNKLLGKEIHEEEIEKISKQFSLLVKTKVIDAPFINGADLFIKKYASDTLQFICTGTPEDEILEILKKKNINHLFRGIYGSPKKKTQIIAYIIEKNGLLPSEILYFGDALTDYDAALSFKIPFVGIQNSNTTFPPNTYIIKDFIELL